MTPHSLENCMQLFIFVQYLIKLIKFTIFFVQNASNQNYFVTNTLSYKLWARAVKELYSKMIKNTVLASVRRYSDITVSS